MIVEDSLRAYSEFRRQGRNPEAEALFPNLVDTYHDRLYHTLRSMYPGVLRDDVEDSLQEVWRELAEKRKPLGEGGQEFAYLVEIAKNKLRDVLKERSRRAERELEYITVNPPANRPVEDTAVDDISLSSALAAFPILKEEHPEWYEAFILFVFEGYSHKEIAGKMGITEGKARVLVFRAREWLRERFRRD